MRISPLPLGGSGGGGDTSGLNQELTQQDVLTTLQGALDVTGSEVELGSTTIAAIQAAVDAANDNLEANLASIGDVLNDVYAELLQKIEAGEDVGLSAQAIDDLAAAIAAIYAFPTDYPALGTQSRLDDIKTKLDTVNGHLTTPSSTPVTGTVALSTTDFPSSTANTKLDTINTNLGTDTGTPPSSGTGVRGWLRGIYDRLGAGINVNNFPAAGLTDTELRASSVPVLVANSTTTPSDAGAAVAGIRTTATLMAFNGSNYDRVRSGAPQPTTGTGKLNVYTNPDVILSLNNIATISNSSNHNLQSAYSKFSLQVILGGTVPATTATVDLQGSLNGTNWFTLTTWTTASQSSGDIVFTSDKPVTQVRTSITALSGGTSPTITARVAVAIG